MERRTFMGGLAVGTVAALMPDTAAAADLIAERVRWLRADMDDRMWRFLSDTFPELAPEGTALRAGQEALGAALGAFGTLKEVEHIPVEDQPHPAVQAFIQEASAAIGHGAVTCRAWIESFLADEDPEKDLHLQAAILSVHRSLQSWSLAGQRHRGVELTLEDLGRDAGPERLRARLRKEAQRIRRAERLMEQFSQAAPSSSGLLEITDREVQAKVLAGKARWSQETEETEATAGAAAAEELPLPGEERPDRQNDPGKIFLGVLLIGIGLVAGVFVMFLGVCIGACGQTAVGGIVVFLLGIALIVLAVWGGIRLIQQGSGRGPYPVGEAGPWGPRRVVAAHALSVPTDGWVEAPVGRAAPLLLAVEADGLVRHAGKWFTDADGSPMAPAPGAAVRAPGAPVGALIGRIGEEIFFIGRGTVLPEGPPGRLWLAINTGADGCIGHFVARISVLEPASARLASEDPAPESGRG